MKLNNNDDSHNSGLNLLIYNMLLDIESHPAWVCGLKPLDRRGETKCVRMSHPAWVCGLKHGRYRQGDHTTGSHPAWVCGLKLGSLMCEVGSIGVTPCVGVWIETRKINTMMRAELVTPCVGVWIETGRWRAISNASRSHPAWVCGLKRNGNQYQSDGHRHTLRGCVD